MMIFSELSDYRERATFKSYCAKCAQ